MSKGIPVLEPEQFEALEALVEQGIARAADGLSGMVGGQVTLAAPKLKIVPVTEVSEQIAAPDTVLAGIYLVIYGALNAHVLLALPMENALSLVDLLMGQPEGTTTELGELEVSALGEVGNIIASFFASVVGDVSHEIVLVSPPAVMSDMLGAMLDAVLSEVGQICDEVLLAETAFQQGERAVKAALLMPDLPGLIHIMRKIAPC